MGPTLREFIATRRSEIKDQMASLRAELRQLDAADRAAAETETGSNAAPSRQSVVRAARPTIMDMILDVLKGQPDGAKSDEIIEAVKTKFNVEVPRSSMSPQLSRLKARGNLVMTNNNVWRLTEYETPSEDQSEGVPEVTDEGRQPSSNESQDVHDIFG